MPVSMHTSTLLFVLLFVMKCCIFCISDELVDNAVDNLVVRLVAASPLHHAELDSTALNKPQRIAIPASRRCRASAFSRPLPSYCLSREQVQHVPNNRAWQFRRHAVASENKDLSSSWPRTFFRSCDFEEECPLLPWAPGEKVGTYSCHGLDPAPPQWSRSPGNTAESVAKINQDCGCIVYPFANNPQQALFAVFDGHGDHGEKVSEFAMEVMHDTLEKHPSLVGDEAAAFEAAFTTADRALSKSLRRESKESGTSAVAALLRGNQVWVANTGDCRCVLASKSEGEKVSSSKNGISRFNVRTKDLSTDHKPDSPGERERIERSGGYVEDPEVPGYPARVYYASWFGGMGPGLAMARSIGDHAVKKVGVIASPEVKVYDLTSDDLFMILASDGVWEFISSQEAVEIVWNVLQDGGDASEATAILIEKAKDLWRKEEGDYRDDITAIVVAVPLFDGIKPWKPVAS
eukprot:gnl/MRDRNA2_/MRDRNA2_62295_c0_seq1.p1 gnl/MRDRNA2_/MRDRNA2_62295_c0~~gnl/MRDRNA2_/MRDRNA2_62295_c0_seq1.p1  ORF type:complete len:463 (+),score=67.74 gnl/MRDRNA2_/MRDRNA2_62295_c0_seq1:43-1431(+)